MGRTQRFTVMLVYASVRIDSDPASFNGRMSLAIMEHNGNVGHQERKGRKQKTF